MARGPVSERQEALDRVLVTWAGEPVAVLRQHIELAWDEVGAPELDDATLTGWSERMGEGLRVIVPPEWDVQPS